MKTKTIPLALPFALLLSLAVAACPSSDGDEALPDQPSGTDDPGRGGSDDNGVSDGGSGGAGTEGAAKACLYEESSRMYCPDAGPTDFGGDPVPKCRNGACDLEARDYVSGGCRFTTSYYNEREIPGTCEEHERAEAGDRNACELTKEEPLCAACARRECCNELAACADPDACMAYARCRINCWGHPDVDDAAACQAACVEQAPTAEADRAWEAYSCIANATCVDTNCPSRL